jgi:hypothetical protein
MHICQYQSIVLSKGLIFISYTQGNKTLNMDQTAAQGEVCDQIIT